VTLTWAGFDNDFEATADNVTWATRTDAAGGYLFEHLPAGSFTVTVDTATLPAGLRVSTAPGGRAEATAEFELAAQGTNLDQDFGLVGDRSIGDLVWSDVNVTARGTPPSSPSMQPA
jgi:large repetitive protein